jgi:hypothetical protein
MNNLEPQISELLQSSKNAEFSFDGTCFGVPFQFISSSARLLDEMLALAPFGSVTAVDSVDAARCFTLLQMAEGVVYCDGESAGFECAEMPILRERLSSDLMVHIANNAPDRTFLHAGVVVRQGSALLLPGTSYAGKSSLVAELVRSGALYYSDEYAVLDDEGLVHPYPRPLQMRQPGQAEQSALSVHALGGIAGTAGVPVRQIIFTRYAASAIWAPQPVSPGLAIIEMLRHTIPVQRTPARVMATLAKVMHSASAWRSDRGEAHDVARILLSMLAEVPGQVAP